MDGTVVKEGDAMGSASTTKSVSYDVHPASARISAILSTNILSVYQKNAAIVALTTSDMTTY